MRVPCGSDPVAQSKESPEFRMMMTMFLFPGATTDQVRALDRLQRLAATPKGAEAIYRMNASFGLLDDAARTQCPLLVLQCVGNQAWPAAEAQLLHSVVAGFGSEYFDSPYHVPMFGERAFESCRPMIGDFWH